MTNRLLRNSKTGTTVIPIGIYWLLCFDLIRKRLRSFRYINNKASINAISLLLNPSNPLHLGDRRRLDPRYEYILCARAAPCAPKSGAKVIKKIGLCKFIKKNRSKK